MVHFAILLRRVWRLDSGIDELEMTVIDNKADGVPSFDSGQTKLIYLNQEKK